MVNYGEKTLVEKESGLDVFIKTYWIVRFRNYETTLTN